VIGNQVDGKMSRWVNGEGRNGTNKVKS